MAGIDILVVDDDHPYALYLQRLLQKAGYRVGVEFSGVKALQTMRAEGPDVVLSNTRMAGMSGFETFEQIRRDPDMRHTVVILMTNAATDEEVIRGFRLFSDCHIPRPVNDQELLAFLHRVLRGPADDGWKERRSKHFRDMLARQEQRRDS